MFESLDRDHTSRRLSPTSLLTRVPGGKKYMSLYTGQPLYTTGWSRKVTRWNTLWLTGHLGATHEVHHSSSNPKVTRIQMLDVYNTDAVHVKYYYGTSNRVDVYVKGRRIPPIAVPAFDNPDAPDLSNGGQLDVSPHGTNYYNRFTDTWGCLRIRANHCKDTDAIVLTATPTVTEERFFTVGVKGLVTNVALLLGTQKLVFKLLG